MRSMISNMGNGGPRIPETRGKISTLGRCLVVVQESAEQEVGAAESCKEKRKNPVKWRQKMEYHLKRVKRQELELVRWRKDLEKKIEEDNQEIEMVEKIIKDIDENMRRGLLEGLKKGA